MGKIGINRDKAKELFYEFKGLESTIQALSGIVQNPDFSVKQDLESFKECCNIFEERYKNVKKEVIKLFESTFT